MMKNETRGHYKGFWIDWYDDLLSGEKTDIKYYTDLLNESDGPVLELACGTGRVLIPLIKAGIPCYGIDLSEDMLDIARKKLASEKLSSNLSAQDMITFSLDKRFKTIIVPGGSLQLISSYEDMLDALNNVHKHLETGGRFICDLWIPWDEIVGYQPNIWKTGRTVSRPNGEKLVVTYSKTFDLEKQVQSGLFRYDLYRENLLKETWADEISLSWFGVNEFKLILEKCGFKNIQSEKRSMMSTHGVSTVYFATR